MVLVYDVNVKRVDKVRKYLKKHLNWVQNSVLEGKVTKAELRRIKTKIKDIINPEEDSILIYKVRTPQYIERTEIGQTKGNKNKII
ncbi:CRISPR-associated endonuclease Cas2 [Methanonatronarchaeum sp. AMET6-2]|uniref:CRISPR-associated endonuclease Cas2 n=1 Tax=Methanonatronarchaeum sp. AMET6-2 TaxID=2933293 RepID=UPI0021124891|nr:CRISPR-associated endonuclease Cas2 [Methanonatronarchaeum sp. AMET6-2]